MTYVNHHQWLLLCLSHIQPRAPYDFYHPYDCFYPIQLLIHKTDFTTSAINDRWTMFVNEVGDHWVSHELAWLFSRPTWYQSVGNSNIIFFRRLKDKDSNNIRYSNRCHWLMQTCIYAGHTLHFWFWLYWFIFRFVAKCHDYDRRLQKEMHAFVVNVLEIQILNIQFQVVLW